MKLLVFAVYDSAVGAYMQPFFMQSKGQAIRAWLDTTNDPKTQFHAHPSDFTLFYLANYDELSGSFENLHTPISLGTALEMRARHVESENIPTAGSIRDNIQSIIKKEERSVQ